jgi:hypothetical protein
MAAWPSYTVRVVSSRWTWPTLRAWTRPTRTFCPATWMVPWTPDRTLIHSQRHLMHALREFEAHYNTHRPHQGIGNARPLAPLPEPIADPDRTAHLNIHRRDCSAASSTRTNTPPDLPGRHYRQAHRRAAGHGTDVYPSSARAENAASFRTPLDSAAVPRSAVTGVGGDLGTRLVADGFRCLPRPRGRGLSRLHDRFGVRGGSIRACRRRNNVVDDVDTIVYSGPI